MDFDAYLEAIRTEGDRLAAAAELGLDAPVPSCPGWAVSDLVAHLARVHRQKAQLVEEGWIDGQPDPPHPPTSGLVEWYRGGVDDLVRVLGEHAPSQPAWTWYAEDQTVGFWYRRMACETLVHRIDGELAHGVVTDVDRELAADVADEILTVMMEGYPPWADVAFDDRSVRIELSDADEAWTLRHARFAGTSPNTGTTFDDEPTFIFADLARPATVVRGTAEDVALFLWGRRPPDGLEVTGDVSMLDELRRVATDVTQ